jgi:hypothetical protein
MEQMTNRGFDPLETLVVNNWGRIQRQVEEIISADKGL